MGEPFTMDDSQPFQDIGGDLSDLILSLDSLYILSKIAVLEIFHSQVDGLIGLVPSKECDKDFSLTVLEQSS